MSALWNSVSGVGFEDPELLVRIQRGGCASVMAVDSISFGRFASESLAWEKWSSFSHNRYMEEVEKYSVPGSVAQKKAYFEAYYKRKRSQIAAESVDTEGAQSGPDDNVENCDSECRTRGGWHIQDSENASVHKAEHAQGSLVKVDISEGGNQSVSCNELKEATVVGVDGEVANGEKGDDIAASKTSPEESENQPADMELQISGKVPLKESYDFNKDKPVADPPKKKSPNASPQRPQINGIVGRPKKTNASPARPSQSPVALSKKENDAIRNGNCFASCTPNIRNKATPRNKKIGTEVPSVRDKTTPSKRLDMSLSLSSGQACEATPPCNRSSETSDKIGKVKGGSTYSVTPDQSSLSEPSRPSAKESINTSPTSFATKMNRLESRSPLKYSCLSGIRMSCKNWSSSFRLRTEERAEKRKEFFSKLQERAKAEEAEKLENQNKKKVAPSHALRFKLGKKNEATAVEDAKSCIHSTASIRGCYAKFTRKLQ
ncbi:protein WVD2-like 7 isoform X2 [Nymphaea colorata]|uniref:protein WVD2-like 7 isoform X2 n=1 Tax=Nymphaea colorata TaxID=210225 RepID=UPI00129D3E22|nr:protein WVD2-like 7 isoform X2 [Nymphaea colorata]